MNKYKRLMVPWGKDTPDARGFFAYAKQHYLNAEKLAFSIAFEKAWAEPQFWNLVIAIFDKIASPLVYLYESWEVLSPEEKAKYDPELAKIHEQSKRMAEEAFK